MAGARKNAFTLAVFMAGLASSFGARDIFDPPFSAGILLQVARDADNCTSPGPLVPMNVASGMPHTATDPCSSTSPHTKLLTAHFDGALPIATGATAAKGSSKTAEQRRTADDATAGITQSESSTRQLLATSDASSSSKAGPTPYNAEQMAQKGLKADIAEALKGSGSPTKNAGDRH